MARRRRLPPPRQSPQRGRQITACRDWRSKNETDASSLGEVCFLIATFVQRMRPRRILLIIKINIDSFAPAQLALRANLRLLYLAPATALDCLERKSRLAPDGADALPRFAGIRAIRGVLCLFRPDLDFVFSRFQPGEGAYSGICWVAGLAEVIGVDLHRRAVGICKGGF